MSEYDFTPRVNPMQGISLADLVAARTSPLTTALQQGPAILQALNARRQQAQQLASLQAMQSGQTLTPEQIMNIPPQATDYAKLQDIQAQTAQRLTPKSPSERLSQEQKDNFEWGLQNNLVAPKQMTYRGPKAEILSNMLGHMRTGSIPKKNLMDLDAMLTGQTSQASATGHLRGGKAEEVAAMAGTVEDTLDKVEPLLKDLSPTQIVAMNSAYQKGLKHINDPEVNETLTLMNEATALQAVVLHGGGTATDEDLKLARTYLYPGISQRGFSGVKKAVGAVNASRVRRLKGLQNNIPPEQPGTIRVRLKSSGQTGTIPGNEFDPNIYEKI